MFGFAGNSIRTVGDMTQYILKNPKATGHVYRILVCSVHVPVTKGGTA